MAHEARMPSNPCIVLSPDLTLALNPAHSVTIKLQNFLIKFEHFITRHSPLVSSEFIVISWWE